MKKHLKILNKFLIVVEKSGNKLPHPATLFALLSTLVVLISFVAFEFNWSVLSPTSHEIISPINLLNRQSIHEIINSIVDNFTSFAPLGIVIVAMLGIGVAEESGLINATIRLIILKTPPALITFVIIFTGVMSNIASDAGHVLIIPLAGAIFASLGRHPIVGIAAAFAGVSGCYSANMLLGTLDPLLSGLSTEAAHIINIKYEVTPTSNYFFMATSAIILSIVGTWITEKIIAPRFGEYEQKSKTKIEKLTPIERKGIKKVTILSLTFIAMILISLIPENGFFRGLDGSIIHSPLLKGVITVLFLFGTTMGVVYGFTTKKFKTDTDVMNGMSKSVKSLAIYIVIVFFASQFVALFKMSNLGVILAVNGANLIKNSGLDLIPLTIIFIIFSATMNLFMGSASAKWAIMAPIFVPMFMLLGYSPEFTQAVYRIGDSSTNIISPMLSFFPLVITFFKKYDNKAGIGTIISTMLPYSIIFLFVWTLLIIAWVLLYLPLGPGAEIFYWG
ncbi:MAG: AbgT family transporter [Bacteroidales bacterium]|nr:AbgT family transporter [Bacteroidales bacterium]